MIKHLEIKTYEYGDIKVTVQINYDRSTISLIDSCTLPHLHDRMYNKNCLGSTPKQYVFANRSLEYMNGWRNVLLGINYAIDQAEAELSGYIEAVKKEKSDSVTAILMEATDMVKGRQQKCIKHSLLDCKSKKCKRPYER